MLLLNRAAIRGLNMEATNKPITKKRPLHKRIRDWFLYIATISFIKILRILPRSNALGFMRIMGGIIFRLAKGERAKTVRHLTLAFGCEKDKAEIDAIAHNVFVHFATVLADTLRMPVMIEEGINKYITIEGAEYLDTALKTGNGVIMMTGHFGNWELLGAWLAQNGYPLKVVGKTLNDRRIDKIIVDIRNRAGYANIPRGKGTREIIRALQKGGAIGMLIDQDTEVQSAFVSFFGRPARTPTGPVLLAKKLHTPILPIFMRLRDDFTYHIECGPPIAMEQTGNEKSDLIVNTQKCSDKYEEIIRRFPEQWVWMHKRWHKQPADNKEGYRISEPEPIS